MAEREPAATGWESQAVEQRRAWLALSYIERLRWLEEAKRFCALALGAARRKLKEPPPDNAR